MAEKTRIEIQLLSPKLPDDRDACVRRLEFDRQKINEGTLRAEVQKTACETS